MLDIKRWLCAKLSEIESVRACTLSADGCLIIHTWTGTLVHVHLLSEPARVRTLKRILGDNTRIGIGTLFLMDAALLPSDGALVTPDEGLLALHALFRDKVYTFRQTADGVKIGQVHFKQIGRSDSEAWYGPDVEIKHLPSYRVWIKQPQSLRGDWLVANFGTEAFWKQPDYMSGRSAFRQQSTRGNTQFYTWSSGWNSAGGHSFRTPLDQLPESELDQCYKLLGLERGASDDAVKTAFRKLAREFHPDVSALPKDEAEARFKRLYAAYRFIKTARGG
jgi:hypothetical protein